ALLRIAKRHLKPHGRRLLTTPNPSCRRFRQPPAQRRTRSVMAKLAHTRWISISNMHEIALPAGLALTPLRWPVLKKPKRGLQREAAMFAKSCLLALAPLEEVFTEYAFELAILQESRSRQPAEATQAAASAG